MGARASNCRCRQCFDKGSGNRSSALSSSTFSTMVEGRAEVRVGKIAVSGRYHRNRKVNDDYEQTIDVIGSGMNGNVYLTTSRCIQKSFAVKTLALSNVSEKVREEAAREAEIMLSMDHPHVVRLRDIYEHNDKLHFVMEYMEGGELFVRVKAKMFNEQQAARVVWQMLLAVNYIHARGVVHRDIKLENFLYESQKGDHLKLIDFGFGHFLQRGQALSANCGTIAYVAPEVLRGNYTSQCDLWSLGCVAFMMLGGYMPFSGDQNKMMKTILDGTPTYKQQVWCNISAPGKDFIQKLLTVNPASRMSAKDALRHPWLVKHRVTNNGAPAVDRHVFNTLCQHAGSSEYRRACLSALSWSLNARELAKVRGAFLDLDKDHTGVICLVELSGVLKTKFSATDQQVRAIFSSLDIAGDGCVRYSEFLAAMCNSSRVTIRDEHIRDTFRRLDKNGTGFITPDEVTDVLGIRSEEVRRLLGRVDQAGDQQISFEELASYLKAETAGNHVPWYSVAAAKALVLSVVPAS